MIRFIISRLLWAIPVVVGSSLLIFVIMHSVPGDPVKIFYGVDLGSDPVMLQQKRAELGLDDPLYIQYGRFVWDVLRGEWGQSIQTGRPVLPDLLTRLRNTAELATIGIFLATIAGIGLGLLSVLKPYSWLDNLGLAISLLGISMPVFWIGLILMWVFAVQLNALPATGREGWQSYILPGITMSGTSLAMVARLSRASMLEVINRDYVRTARSKGVGETRIMIRHVLPNALLAIITVVGLQFGYLLAGAVLTESVFAWPGLGRMIVDAIKARDYPVVQSGVLLIAIIFVLINLLVDLLYGVLDPRVRSRAQ